MGLIGNLSIGETLLILVLAVLVFGRRLPEVAAQAFAQLRKLRRMVDDVRRETGIDREIRSLSRPLESAAREIRSIDPGAVARSEPKPTPPAAIEPKAPEPSTEQEPSSEG